MKRIIHWAARSALLFILLPAFVLPARAQTSVTLQEAIEMARDNSQRIRQAYEDVRRSSLAVSEGQAGRLPTLSADGRYVNNVQTPVIFLPEGSPFGTVLRTGMRHNVNLNAQAAVPVYNAQLNRSIDLARAARNLNEVILEVTEREVEIEVQRAFLSGLLTREARDVLESSYQTRVDNLELIRSMYEEGVSPEYDLIRIEVQVENMQPELIRARNDHEGALNYVKLLTGIPVETDISLDGSLADLFASIPNIVFEADFSDNPSVVQLEAQRELVEHQIAIERAAYLPSLSAFGNYTIQSQSNDLDITDYNWVTSASVGLQIAIPIFDRSRRYRVEQAEVDRNQLEIQHDFLLESLRAEFQTTSSRLQQVEQSIEAQRRNVAQAERGLRIARVSYENGVHSVVDVNDAELALTEARLNYTNVLSEYVNAVLDIENLLGRSLSGS